MNAEIINPLRRRMIEDMTARNLDEATQRVTSERSGPAADIAAEARDNSPSKTCGASSCI